MTVKILPNPSSHTRGTSVGNDYFYAPSVPRVGDSIRLDAKHDDGFTVVIGGTITGIETHLGSDPEETYVIVHFDPN